MFLGVFIEDMNLGRVGWGIMIGYTLWVIILPLIIEIFSILFENNKSIKTKNFFLLKK